MFFIMYMTYLLLNYLIIAHQEEIITGFLANTSSECLNSLHNVVLDFNYWYS